MKPSKYVTFLCVGLLLCPLSCAEEGLSDFETDDVSNSDTSDDSTVDTSYHKDTAGAGDLDTVGSTDFPSQIDSDDDSEIDTNSDSDQETDSISEDGSCCPDGNCLCHSEPPPVLSAAEGDYNTDSYSIEGTGCVYYPTDAEPPFAAVAISDGFLGIGGCGVTQTDEWGRLYASHGIVAMIVETGSTDLPAIRGDALLDGIDAFKEENEDSTSPLFGTLAGRYGTSGFSMGGGGTTIASADDPSLLSSIAIMPWQPVGKNVTVPTMIICGSFDGIAGCGANGTPAYEAIPDTTPKIKVTILSGHVGQPSAGEDMSGAWGLAFQKVFLEGDERWREILIAGDSESSNLSAF